MCSDSCSAFDLFSAHIFLGVPLLQLGSMSYSTANLEENKRYKFEMEDLHCLSISLVCVWRVVFASELIFIFFYFFYANTSCYIFRREHTKQQSVQMKSCCPS